MQSTINLALVIIWIVLRSKIKNRNIHFAVITIYFMSICLYTNLVFYDKVVTSMQEENKLQFDLNIIVGFICICLNMDFLKTITLLFPCFLISYIVQLIQEAEIRT